MSNKDPVRFVELLQAYSGALEQDVDYTCPAKLKLRMLRSGLAFRHTHKSALYGVLVNEARNTLNHDDPKLFATVAANYIVECCHPALHAVPKFEILKLSASQYDYFKGMSIDRPLIESLQDKLHNVVLKTLQEDGAI